MHSQALRAGWVRSVEPDDAHCLAAVRLVLVAGQTGTVLRLTLDPVREGSEAESPLRVHRPVAARSAVGSGVDQ